MESQERWLSRLEPWGRFVAYLYASIKSVPGCIVEAGVWEGGTLSFFLLLDQLEGRNRPVFGFDVFERDSLTHVQGKEPDLRTQPVKRVEVMQRLKQNGWDGICPPLALIPGLFDDSIPSTYTGGIAFAHLDCDYYLSYKTALTHLWPRMEVGGVMVFDEYQSRKFTGAKKAIDEYLEGRPHYLFHDLRTYAVKTGDGDGR